MRVLSRGRAERTWNTLGSILIAGLPALGILKCG